MNQKLPILIGGLFVVVVVLGSVLRRETPLSPIPEPANAALTVVGGADDAATKTVRRHVAGAKERTRALRGTGDSIRGDRTESEREQWLNEFRLAAFAGTSAMIEQIEAGRDVAGQAGLNPAERASLLRESAMWLVGADAGKARALLAEMPNFRDRRLMASVMIDTLAKSDFVKAVDWVSGLNQQDLSAHAHENLAKALARQDVSATIEWISGIADAGDQVAAGEGLMFSWTQTDLDGALNWAGQLESSGFRDGVYLKTSKMVAINDPATATQWAAGFPGNETRSQAMTYALHRWIARDPRAAADWAAKSQGDAAGSSELSTVMTVWGERDPEAANAWLNSQAAR
jgi:hypothetical protein